MPQDYAGALAKSVDIAEAIARFAELLDRAEAGEEIVVCRDQVPVVRIVPARRPRVRGFGSMKDEIRIGRGVDEPVQDLAEYQ